MFTTRPIPPHWLARKRNDAPPTFLDIYYRALWAHWRWTDRVLSLLLLVLAVPFRLGSERFRLNLPGRLHAAMSAQMRDGARPEHFLWQPARKGVHRLLNPAAFPFATSPLKNKHLFAERCRAAGLPHPETLRSGADAGAVAAFLKEHRALILKPNFSSRGRGVESWPYDGGAWRGPAGETLSPNAMAARVAESLKAGAIVQQRLQAHDGIADLSPGVLPSLRIITCRGECGLPEVTDVVLRLSAGGAKPVDNFMAGGIAAVIDGAGVVRRALVRAGSGFCALSHHPATRAMLEGHAVPDFTAATALAIRAHAAIGEGFTIIGWDIGVTANGPVLIEGNWNPGGETLQLPQGEGLASRRLGDLFRHHLERLPPEAWRAARPIQREP